MCIADCSDQFTYKEAQSSGFYILHSTHAVHDNDYHIEHVKYTELWLRIPEDYILAAKYKYLLLYLIAWRFIKVKHCQFGQDTWNIWQHQ